MVVILRNNFTVLQAFVPNGLVPYPADFPSPSPWGLSRPPASVHDVKRTYCRIWVKTCRNRPASSTS